MNRFLQLGVGLVLCVTTFCVASWGQVASTSQISVFVQDDAGPVSFHAICAQCGEGVSFRREVIHEGRTLCRACAGDGYYDPA